jgi:hypothetical protein
MDRIQNPISHDTLFGGEPLSRRIPIQFLKNHVLAPLKFRAEAAFKTLDTVASGGVLVYFPDCFLPEIHFSCGRQPVPDESILFGLQQGSL